MTDPQVRPDPAFGLLKLYDDALPHLSYRVDDIAAAVVRVRAAGGRADDPEHRPFGLLAECVDDQGATFHLWQPVDRPKR